MLLIEKGIVDPAAMDEVVALRAQDRAAQRRKGGGEGVDISAYKAHLLSDASAAIAEMGFSGAQGEDMVVLENTPTIYNVVVCTLCSCYPWPVLGLPPVWYSRPPIEAASCSNLVPCWRNSAL